MYRRFFKRFFDFILSLLALILLSPLMLLLGILVGINMGWPILFKQRRVGKNEKIFMMYKFRTMSDKKDENGNLLPDEKRVTKFGKFLRSTSLDELPELFNILKGDLSIIGPRPLLVEYLPYYTEQERIRHTVRGGLTVPEVLHDNVTPTWEEQFSYEVEYAQKLSFALDIKILVYTVRNLVKRNSDNYGGYVRKSLVEERTQTELLEEVAVAEDK